MLARSKKVIRKVLDHSVAAIRPHRWAHPEGSLLILTYHRILPPSFHEMQIVEPGMFVHTSTFETHLQILRSEFEVVDLASWLRAREEGKAIPARACAITFDDGWYDNFDYALPLLKQYETPATIFVVAGMVGTTKQFWPERLARLMLVVDQLGEDSSNPGLSWVRQLLQRLPDAGGNLSSHQISELIQIAKQWPDNQVIQYLDQVEGTLDQVPPLERPDLLNWDQLKEMVSTGLINVGSHTTNHVRLNESVNIETVSKEVIGSKKIIEENLSAPVDLFCYPNGDLSANAVGAVAKNYVGACTTRSGWNPADADRSQLSRISVHEGRARSKAAFLARISGLSA